MDCEEMGDKRIGVGYENFWRVLNGWSVPIWLDSGEAS